MNSFNVFSWNGLFLSSPSLTEVPNIHYVVAPVYLRGTQENGRVGAVETPPTGQKAQKNMGEEDAGKRQLPIKRVGVDRFHKRNRNPQNAGRRKRNPERNSLTNVSNLMLIFAHTEKRSKNFIQRCFPQISGKQMNSYYYFAKQIKDSMRGYLNQAKLTSILREFHPESELNYRILRCACCHYVREKLPLTILISKKIGLDSKQSHLKARRKLLQLLLSPSH